VPAHYLGGSLSQREAVEGGFDRAGFSRGRGRTHNCFVSRRRACEARLE